MLLRSGFEYTYSAPSTHSRKRKQVDDGLIERPSKRQDTTPAPEEQPFSSSPPSPVPEVQTSSSSSPPSPASLVNTIVGQEFQLLRVLVQGGSAYIYLGQSVKDNSYVAVKALVKPESDHDMQLLQIEIDIHSSFNHSNIVSLHRVFEDDNYFYLVMELCDQGDLFDYLFAGHESSTPHELIAKQMFSQVLDSVEHMHANSVFHRDLKLENIFLKSHGEHHVVCKVGDFGLSTRERTSTDFGCGSASYLPPEQLKRDRPYDCAASDVWSLGIVLLLLMFGGDYPWQTATDDDSSFVEFKRDSSVLKKRLYPGLSSATCRLLESMLAMDGADRPSVSEIKKQFSVIDHFYADDTESSPSSSSADAALLSTNNEPKAEVS